MGQSASLLSQHDWPGAAMLWTLPATRKAIFKNVASVYSDSSLFFNFTHHKQKTSIATKSS